MTMNSWHKNTVQSALARAPFFEDRVKEVRD